MEKILIVGTGALATLFAARLAQSVHQVIMLGTWQAGLDALRKDGIEEGETVFIDDFELEWQD